MKRNQKIGENIYLGLKKNNIAVWAISLVCLIVSLASLAFSFFVYSNSANTIFAINEKGEMLPMKRLEEKKDKLIQVKANIELFVNLYYNIDAFNMKERRERIRWLLGDMPTKTLVHREKSGYFDEFLTLNGLRQNAYILQNTLKINNDEPYNADFTVRVERIIGKQIRYFDNNVNLTMIRVNRNYPYNPYGVLITDIKEDIKEIIDAKSQDLEEDIKASEEKINQNISSDE